MRSAATDTDTVQSSPTDTVADDATLVANAPGHDLVVNDREEVEAVAGENGFISWAACSDVGLVRAHNEDSFLCRAPVFAVCDGMGGHAGGEVASSIAVETIADHAPITADDLQLGAAIEEANLAVIKGASDGIGKPGMGCTASAILVEGNKLAIAHVGDSRVYLLHHGSLVRVTHDHSYVEELVDSGQITADEAREHPSRSIITRALGSDPDMYADHFSLEIFDGDRIIICSDGLSSMVPDAEIEALATSSVSPQQAVDNLVSAALEAGGVDNITVVVVDILNDGVEDSVRQHTTRTLLTILASIAAVLIAGVLIMFAFISNEWYLGESNTSVGIYQGIKGDFFGIPLSKLVSTSSVEISDLPEAVQDQLKLGIRVSDEASARDTINAYRQQIEADKQKASDKATETLTQTDPSVVAPEEALGSSADFDINKGQ